MIAPDLQLQVISAAVVGGVSIFGGSGTLIGAALGAVIFAVLQNGVQLLGINQFWLQAVLGAAILLTVVVYSRLARRAEQSERDARRSALRKPERCVDESSNRGSLIRGLWRWKSFLLIILLGTLIAGSEVSALFRPRHRTSRSRWRA